MMLVVAHDSVFFFLEFLILLCYVSVDSMKHELLLALSENQHLLRVFHIKSPLISSGKLPSLLVLLKTSR